MVSRVVVGALVTLMLGACGDLPPREVGFDSPDPAGRVDALRRAAANDDPEAIPGLIGMLSSDDPAQRMLANRALIDITGKDFGFHHADPEGERYAATDRWKAWWGTRPAAGSGGEPSLVSVQDAGAGYPVSDGADAGSPPTRPAGPSGR